MSLKRFLTTLVLSAVIVLPAKAALMINEVDSDTDNTPTTDFAEFMELYDSSGTSVSLNGYVLVFFNGGNASNAVYRVEDLDGKVTRPNGFFVAGAVAGADLAIPGNTIQNGGDAIALYLGNATDFPVGQALTVVPAGTTLIDAVVYKTGADTDGDDMVAALLTAGGVVDEWGRDGTATTGIVDSVGRLPNGAGNMKDTTAWTYMIPTPGLPNSPVVPEPATLALLLVSVVGVGLSRRTRG